MFLYDPKTGEAQLNGQPKPLPQVLLEVERMFFGMCQELLPNEDLDALDAAFIESVRAGGGTLHQFMKQNTVGNQADWLAAALAAIQFVRASRFAEEQHLVEIAWSHAATASAWINYARGIAALGPAVVEEAEVKRQEGSKAATDAQWDVPRKVRAEALRLIVSECPPQRWAGYEAAAAAIVDRVVTFGKTLGWESDDPKRNVRDWARAMPDKSKYFPAKSANPKRKEAMPPADDNPLFTFMRNPPK